MCLIRSCIVGCYTTEDYFLAKEGVILLLDLLRVNIRWIPNGWSLTEVLCFLCPYAPKCKVLMMKLPHILFQTVEPQMRTLHHPRHPARVMWQPEHCVSHPELEGRRRSDGSQTPAAAVEGRGGGAESQPKPTWRDRRSVFKSTLNNESMTRLWVRNFFCVGIH